MDQLKVAWEVGGCVFSGNNVPLERAVPSVPQGAAYVQAASFGREVPRKPYDVLWGDRENFYRAERTGDGLINS